MNTIHPSTMLALGLPGGVELLVIVVPFIVIGVAVIGIASSRRRNREANAGAVYQQGIEKDGSTVAHQNVVRPDNEER